MVAAEGPTLPGIVCASRAQAASKSAEIPARWRTLFIALFLFLHSRRRRSIQTLFSDDFHRILDGNLRDAAGPVDPFQLFVGFGIFLNFLAQIGLPIGFMASDALEPRLRRQRPIVLAKSLAGPRRKRIDGRRIVQ